MTHQTATPQTNAFAITPGRFAILLGLLIFAAFPKVMLGQESFYFRDYGVLGYPFVFFHRESFWNGELPLWNPLSNCGTPFLAQWGTMTLYPLSLIYLLFPLPWSLGYFCLGHLFLGGMGMYYLARRWTGHDFAAGFAGVAYVFNGVTFSSLIWPNYAVALGWTPWIVLWTQRAWREGGRAMAVAAILGALQMLSGVPELILMTWLVVGGLWLMEAVQNRSWRSGARLAVVVLLVAGLTAIQLLPFFDLLSHSQRDRTYATSKWAMPGWGWANLLVPLFHTFKTPHGVCFQHGQAFMSSYYLGASALVLAVWASWRVRTLQVWVLGGLTLLSLILALGEAGFVYSWIKTAIPFIGFARFPIKFALLAAFTLPLLSGFAIAALAPAVRERRILSLSFIAIAAIIGMGWLLWFAREYPFPVQRWTELWQNTAVRAVLLAAALGSCLAASLNERWRFSGLFAWVTVGLIFTDCVTHTGRQNPTIPTEWLAGKLWQQRNGPAPVGRVFITPEAEKRLLISPVRDPLHDFIGKRLALWSNLNVVDGIAKVNGSSTLQLREQYQFERALYKSNDVETAVSEKLLDFLGVTHVSGSNIVDWVARPTALPFVTAGQRPVFDSGSNVIQLLTSELDPRETVILSPEVRPFVTVTNSGVASITGLSSRPGRVSFRVEADSPALVVIAQSYHPGWRAIVNRVATPLWQANHAFQALQVTAGRHDVVLEYRDPKFVQGGVVSGGSLLICLLVLRRKATA